MRSFSLAVLALALSGAVAIPSVAEDGAVERPRFSLTPDAEGFVRLDTLTGALTQCRRVDGLWQCSPAIEEASALTREVRALAERVGALDRRIADLEKARQPAPQASVATAAAPSFPARLQAKLFGLVGALKPGAAGRSG